MRLTLVLSLLSILRLVAAQQDCSRTEQVSVTFYGFPDNTPPGPGIRCDIETKSDCDTCNNGNANNIVKATQCGPRQETAGGNGTFSNPLTMASAGKWFCPQELVYLPYLKKYLRYEDYCQQCIDDARSGKTTHIDIWTGSVKVNGGKVQVDCENTLTPSALQTMVRNPSPDLPVDASDLFTPNAKQSTCNGTIVGSSPATIVRPSISVFSVFLLVVFILS